MRILHVVPYYHDAWAYGGIPRLASTLVRGLARRGHDVTVCTTDAADERSRAPIAGDQENGVRVRVFRNLSNRLAYHWQFFTPVGLGSFLRSAAREFDIGHIHACHNLPGSIAASALRRARVPYVLSPNGTAPRIERRRLAKLAFDLTFGRRVLPGAARVLAVSAAEQVQLQQAGVEGERVRVLPNPLDDDEFRIPPDGAAFRTAHDAHDAPLVLYLGKLTPRKGVETLVHAFNRIPDPGARLVIAGNDMGAGGRLHDAIASTDDGRVMRIGLLRGRERLDALAAADVVVYPSRDEVFGLVPLEALLCGTPVVVCSDSGCGEVIGRIGGGHIVPVGDVAALAGAIEDILQWSERWQHRATAAARQARSLFSSDVVCSQLEKVYCEVMS